MSNNIRVINFKKGDYEDHQTAISITRVIGYHNFYPQGAEAAVKRIKEIVGL